MDLNELKVRGQCRECQSTLSSNGSNLQCSVCSRQYPIDESVKSLEKCPICDCRRFYRQKDFPRIFGLGIIVVGAVLVPFTYGISLVVLSLIDWSIYKRVPTIAVCYMCRAEFRGILIMNNILPFRHHMAEGYERRRNQHFR